MLKKVAIIDGSLAGAEGNTCLLLKRAGEILAKRSQVEWVDLAQNYSLSEYKKRFTECSGFLFGTGTYWDSWSSVLQRFLEQSTELEGTAVWLGKPAATIVTMHSVGGKEVLSRLQGVFNTLGLLIPPMSGMVYSTVNQVALASGDPTWCQDLWCLEDIELICHNLLEAVYGTFQWKAWPVERSLTAENWIK